MQSWVISRHADCHEVLRNHSLFARDPGRVGKDIPLDAKSIQIEDPPEHLVLRREVMKSLHGQDIKGAAARARQRMAELLADREGMESFDLMAEVAVGSLIGTLFSGFTGRITKQGKWLILSCIAWGVMVLGFGISSQLIPSIAFLVAMGFVDVIALTFGQTIIQNETPDAMRRVGGAVQRIEKAVEQIAGEASAVVTANLNGSNDRAERIVAATAKIEARQLWTWTAACASASDAGSRSLSASPRSSMGSSCPSGGSPAWWRRGRCAGCPSGPIGGGRPPRAKEALRV